MSLVGPAGVLGGLGERGSEALDEDAGLQALGPVCADVASEFPGAKREPDQRGLAQIQASQQLVEVCGERVEVVAVGCAA